eukprot:s2562_g5.t1
MARAAQMQTLPAHSVCWQPAVSRLLGTIGEGAEAFKAGEFLRAKALLAEAADVTTGDERKAFSCSLGIAALYRALAYAYCSHVARKVNFDLRMEAVTMYAVLPLPCGAEIGCVLRLHSDAKPELIAGEPRKLRHLAMNWLTHTFVSTNHDQALIDGSAWPIGIQDINNDLTSVYAAIQKSGPSGHAPTAAGRSVPHNFRRQDMRIAIVSLCVVASGGAWMQ